MKVDNTVSDMFFNMDHSESKVFYTCQGKTVFSHFKIPLLTEDAKNFVSWLADLGIPKDKIPTTYDLVYDFLARV